MLKIITHVLFNSARPEALMLLKFAQKAITARNYLATQASACGTATNKALVSPVAPPVECSNSKVTVVGVGSVGMACALAILAQHVSRDLALVDLHGEKLKGEMLDLQYASMFLGNAKVSASSDFAASTGSHVIVVTAGARQKEGETRLDLVQRNTDILKGIVPQMVKNSPNAILLVVTNPVDIMTYISWKVSGLPKNRVIGSGTNLDSARYRFYMAERLGVAPTSCNGWIIGEHGDTSVALWSGVNVGGVNLRQITPNIGQGPNDLEKWSDVHKQVVQSAYKVIKFKGYTSWAIGLCAADITNSILNNSGKIHPVSIPVSGYHGITEDVCLSLPVVLGQKGVVNVIKQTLTEKECEDLHKSASVVHGVQKTLKY